MSESMGDFWIRKVAEFRGKGGQCPVCDCVSRKVGEFAETNVGLDEEIAADPEGERGR